MKTIREIARLHLHKRLSLRAIAGACNLSVSTVQGHVKKIEALGLGYQTITAMRDKELQDRLHPAPAPVSSRQDPDIPALVEELKHSRSNLTRQLLYEEYLQQHPDGYKRTRFYELLRAWEQQDNEIVPKNWTASLVGRKPVNCCHYEKEQTKIQC